MIRKILDISTGHVCKETSELLNAGGGEHTWAIPFEYGWFVDVPEYDCGREQRPADINTVMDYARKHDCEWIKFDCDGELLSDLPKFDW